MSLHQCFAFCQQGDPILVWCRLTGAPSRARTHGAFALRNVGTHYTPTYTRPISTIREARQMSDAEHHRGQTSNIVLPVDRRQFLKTLVEGRKVWFVCSRCDLRWSIADRRSLLAFAPDGPERRCS
jgi:hypothetical protein